MLRRRDSRFAVLCWGLGEDEMRRGWFRRSAGLELLDFPNGKVKHPTMKFTAAFGSVDCESTASRSLIE